MYDTLPGDINEALGMALVNKQFRYAEQAELAISRGEYQEAKVWQAMERTYSKLLSANSSRHIGSKADVQQFTQEAKDALALAQTLAKALRTTKAK